MEPPRIITQLKDKKGKLDSTMHVPTDDKEVEKKARKAINERANDFRLPVTKVDMD